MVCVKMVCVNKRKMITIISLGCIFIFIFGTLMFIQKNIIKNKQTIDNLEHFIENEIPSYFTNKPISPECCPSTYSTDRGCVCLNDEDKNVIYTRGGTSL